MSMTGYEGMWICSLDCRNWGDQYEFFSTKEEAIKRGQSVLRSGDKNVILGVFGMFPLKEIPSIFYIGCIELIKPQVDAEEALNRLMDEYEETFSCELQIDYTSSQLSVLEKRLSNVAFAWLADLGVDHRLWCIEDIMYVTPSGIAKELPERLLEE